jgi:hypothetical protein
MRLHPPDLRRPAGAIAVLATAAGLVLTGCGGSGSGSGSAGANSGSTSAAGNSSSSAASNGGGGSTTTVSSGSAPFPVAVGNTWKYKTVIPGTSTDGRTVNKILSVQQVSSGQKVDMSAAITTDGTTTHSSSYYIFEPDGAISVPFNQFSSANSGAQVELLSGGIFWPPESALQSGQTTHSTLKIKYTISGVKKDVTAHIAVKGSGSQSVTVPAGTYNATVVNMTMSEKIDGYSVTIDVRTWLANGVGPVKTEAILGGIAGNKVASEDELVSFHKG